MFNFTWNFLILIATGDSPIWSFFVLKWEPNSFSSPLLVIYLPISFPRLNLSLISQGKSVLWSDLSRGLWWGAHWPSVLPPVLMPHEGAGAFPSPHTCLHSQGLIIWWWQQLLWWWRLPGLWLPGWQAGLLLFRGWLSLRPPHAPPDNGTCKLTIVFISWENYD